MRSFKPSHVAWAKRVPARHAHDLADSAVYAPDLAAMGLPDRAGLEAGHRAGIDRLEHALAGRLAAPGGRVLVTAGGSEAIACVMAALLSPGEEVLVELPGYEPHREVPRLFGVEIRRFERSAARGYADVAAGAKAGLTPRTRAIAMTNAHNPSGARIPDADFAALEALADAHDLHLVCDEAFRDASDLPIGCAAARGTRWVSIGSLTKAYGLGGLRIGWVAGPPEVIEACAAVQNALSGTPAAPRVALALALLPHLDALRARSHAVLAENRARWGEAAARLAESGLDPGPVSHGTTAFCRGPGEDDGDRFAAFAAERFDVAVTPGRFFGDPRGFRVALGGPPHAFAPALERLERAWLAYSKDHTESSLR